jgi:hypothetical protein
VALVLSTAFTSAANAADISIDSTTVGGPTWNRPVFGEPPVPPLSVVGTNVRYDVTEFTVSQNGAYDFLSVATDPAGWDNYVFLYQTSFDPTDPFTNVIIGNDDFPDIGTAGFDGVGLTAGTSYFFVTTGFANDNAGAYTLRISGPGDITVGGNAIPEPATWALMIGGFAMAGGAARTRRAKVTFA